MWHSHTIKTSFAIFRIHILRVSLPSKWFLACVQYSIYSELYFALFIVILLMSGTRTISRPPINFPEGYLACFIDFIFDVWYVYTMQFLRMSLLRFSLRFFYFLVCADYVSQPFKSPDIFLGVLNSYFAHVWHSHIIKTSYAISIWVRTPSVYKVRYDVIYATQ